MDAHEANKEQKGMTMVECGVRSGKSGGVAA